MKHISVILFLILIQNCFNLHTNVKTQKNIDESKTWKVDEYEDNHKISSYYYKKGLLVRRVVYSKSSNEDVTNYFYKANNKFDYVKSSEPSVDSLLNIRERDFEVQIEYLKNQKKLKFPVSANLLLSEVGDLNTMLSIGDYDDSVKKEIKKTGKQTIINFLEFNKRVRFYKSSYLFLYVSAADKDIIHNYTLTLTNGYPAKEVYLTNRGKLIRKYIYDKKRIVKVSNKFISKKKKVLSGRTFKYLK